MFGPGIVQQAAKKLQPEFALPDVLVTVAPGAPWMLGIVAVPHQDILQTNRFIQLPHRLEPSGFRNYVVSRSMRMAGIDAGADRADRTQVIKQLSHLLK